MNTKVAIVMTVGCRSRVQLHEILLVYLFIDVHKRRNGSYGCGCVASNTRETVFFRRVAKSERINQT